MAVFATGAVRKRCQEFSLAGDDQTDFACYALQHRHPFLAAGETVSAILRSSFIDTGEDGRNVLCWRGGSR